MTVKISICMGSSCFARGNERNLEIIENYLKENSIEGEVELMGAHCEANCRKGPNIVINGHLFEKVDPGLLVYLLDENLK
ncbi:MAG: NAD(P)H-dependent oxidoreductase subunit E [Planctomycetes bacterium]|nr:NAD(P)H-dependent oxidoreductase subunit E [Planctomycetota bacterium]